MQLSINGQTSNKSIISKAYKMFWILSTLLLATPSQIARKYLAILYPSQISPSLLLTIVEASLNKGDQKF